MKTSEANIEDLRNQTVSWGTHRPDDLIPKFLAVLKEYGKEAYDKYVSENPEVEDWKMLDDETKGWVVDELFDLLDGIAPEDCYFGAHPGDGADFGFWQVDESKKNEEVIVDLTLPEAKKIYADVHKNHWDKSEFGKVMGSCLEYEDVSELIDYLIGVYDPGIRDRLDENDELMHLCFILLDEWREEHEPTESKKSESDTATAEQVFKDMADSLGISDRSVITTDGDRVKFVLKLKLKDLVDYAWEYNPKLKVVKNIASPTADAFDGARKTVNTVEDAAAWLRGGIEELLNMEKEAIDLVGNESKKSEAEGNKDIYTLDLTRIDAEGDEEGLDDMQAAQDFYDEDEAIQAAKDLADSYKDDDDVVQVTVLWAQEKPNGDIVDDWFDIFTASSSDSATTAKYRKTAGYAKTDGLDYYAKGGKSEARKSEGGDEEAFGKFEDAVKSILMDKYGVVDSHGPSDETANSLVLQYGATLRDAFDKGGENGYDPTSVALLIITRQLREAPQFFDDCKDFTFNKDPKKSESLTLKQKELKDMARFGQAEDITTISDAEAKELKKKGIETVGISRGTYGMNGALLRDSEGNKYVITARSSNLFYFV